MAKRKRIKLGAGERQALIGATEGATQVLTSVIRRLEEPNLVSAVSLLHVGLRNLIETDLIESAKNGPKEIAS